MYEYKFLHTTIKPRITIAASHILAHHQNCLLENNMVRLLKALPLTLALAALISFATFAASCGSSSTAQARFVNAIADDTQALDIEFNGTKKFTDVGPFAASASTYVSVPTGSDKIQGFATGTTTQAFSQTSLVSFTSGKQYTMVATGTLTGTVNLLTPVDTNTAPANGSVSFRVINASLNGPGSVDVYILPDSAPNTTCFGNVGCPNPTITALPSPVSSINTTSAYVTVPYNSNGFGYTLYVTVSGQTTPLFNGGYSFNVGSVSLGSIRTLVLVDTACTDPCNGGAMSSQPILLSDLN